MKPAFSHILFSFGIMFLLCGCSMHRMQPARLPVEIPSAYESVKTAPPSSSLSTPWWRLFEDETLNSLMEKTFAENLDLAQSVARLQQAEALTRQRRADRFPYLNLEATAGRSRQISTTGASTGNTSTLSLAAGYEVDIWNKVKSRAQAQQLLTDASRRDLYTLYLTLSAQVADYYYLLVEQRAKLDLIDSTITARKENLELVEQRYREGMVSALDLYQARQNMANARAQRPAVEIRLGTTAHTLSVLTGGYPTTHTGGTMAQIPDVPEAFPVGLPSDLLKQRPDIEAAMLKLEAADHQIAVAVADRFPSLNLLADYGHARSDYGTVVSGTVWSLIGQLAMPLVDFQKRKAEVERNEAIFAERLAAYQQTVLKAFQEVEDALLENIKARESIMKTSAEVAAAQDTLRLSKTRYLDGLSDYLPVLTAQTSYFDGQIRLLSAQRQMVSARISLARALGGRWMHPIATEKLEATHRK